MKTTMITRSIANPRRTTLATLEDASTLQAPVVESGPGGAAPLPQVTANPRRTVLMDVPVV